MRHAEEMDASNASMENSEEPESKIILHFKNTAEDCLKLLIEATHIKNFD